MNTESKTNEHHTVKILVQEVQSRMCVKFNIKSNNLCTKTKEWGKKGIDIFMECSGTWGGNGLAARSAPQSGHQGYGRACPARADGSPTGQ